MKKRSLHIILTIGLVTFFSNSFALSNDRDQPADISADEINVNTKTGVRTFIGNVRFIQGTLKVKGDRVDATFKDGKLVKAIAYGKPAAFQQRPDGKENDVEGRGLTIIMNQTINTLTLKKKASLKQGFDVTNGNIIIYNMKNDTLKIKGGAKAGTGNKKPNIGKSKTDTDPFFTKKTPAVAPETDNTSPATQTGKAPVEQVQIIPGSTTPSTQASADDKPKELILPGQSSQKKSGRESSGRARLIIKPKSK